MIDIREALEREMDRFHQEPRALERLQRRRDRDRRNRRIAAGVLAGLIAVGAFGAALRIFHSLGEPATPTATPLSVMWIDSFGTPRLDFVETVATDGTQIYAAGARSHRYSDKGDDESFLRAYDAQGNFVWETLLGTSPTQQVLISAIAADSSAIYMVGSVDEGPVRGLDNGHSGGFFLWKFDLAGNEVWSHQLQEIYPASMAAQGGSVYLGGSTSTPGDSDAVFIRFDSDGNETWVRSFGTPNMDGIGEVVVGPAGVYVSGTLGYRCNNAPRLQCGGGGSRSGRHFVRGYDGSGRQMWQVDLGTGFQSGLAVGTNAIYVAYTDGSAQLVRAIDLGGSDSWTTKVSDPAGEYPVVLAADETSVFVAGGTSIQQLDVDGKAARSFDIPASWGYWWARGGAVAYRYGIVVGGSVVVRKEGSRDHGDAFIARLGSVPGGPANHAGP